MIGSRFRRNKSSSRVFLTSSGEVSSGRSGNLCETQPMANFLAIHIVRGAVCARNDFQCWAFAALQYTCSESLTIALTCGILEARAFREDDSNFFLSVVSSGYYHALAHTEGQQRTVWALRVATSVLRCESNDFSGECLVGRLGGGRSLASLSNRSRLEQSVLTHFGAGGAGSLIGCAILTVMGTWSDPVEGRSVVHSWNKAIRALDANARSKSEALEDP